MGKIDIELRSKCCQSTVGCIEQGICGAIIRRSEPFAFEDSPERLGDIQMWTVRWEEEEIQSTFLPYRTEFPHKFASVDACIVKDNKSVFTDTSDDLKYAMYHRIDHCYFSTPFKLTANTGSAMRIGLGQLGYGRCLIDNNLFERQDGEVELIENKSHENVYIHNTFRNCQAQMSFRQGHSTIFLHNIMEATYTKYFYGGLGMWMDEHIVAGNYFSFPNGSYVPLDKKMKQRQDRLPASVVRFTCGYKDFIQKDKSYATHLSAQNSIFANNTFFDCKDEPFDLSYEESKLPQMNGYPASRPYGNTIKNNTFAYTGKKADRIYANPNDEDFKLNTIENNIVYTKENISENPNTIFTIRHKSLETVSKWMDKIFGHLRYDINKLANSRIAEIKEENGNIKTVLNHQPAKFEEVGPLWLKENPRKFAIDGEYTEKLLREIKRNIGD